MSPLRIATISAQGTAEAAARVSGDNPGRRFTDDLDRSDQGKDQHIVIVQIGTTSGCHERLHRTNGAYHVDNACLIVRRHTEEQQYAVLRHERHG